MKLDTTVMLKKVWPKRKQGLEQEWKQMVGLLSASGARDSVFGLRAAFL